MMMMMMMIMIMMMESEVEVKGRKGQQHWTCAYNIQEIKNDFMATTEIRGTWSVVLARPSMAQRRTLTVHHLNHPVIFSHGVRLSSLWYISHYLAYCTSPG
jgi:hypothetical protein